MFHNLQEDLYLDLLWSLLSESGYSEPRDDRTGVGCTSRFGDQLRFDVKDSFPLLTTKSVYWKGVFHELSWMLRGDTNIKYLTDNKVKIWDEWALTEEDTEFSHRLLSSPGDIGPMYGSQWRKWPGRTPHEAPVDQIVSVINSIRDNPNSRRHVVSAWNPSYLPDESKDPKTNILEGNQALAPCHCLFQFFVKNGALSCQLYQRSADIFLGVPFNIASYSLLLYIIANICDLEVGEFIHTFGDLHLYHNHTSQARVQLSRTSKDFPILKIKKKLTVEDLVQLDINDFELTNYNPCGKIPAPIAI